MVKSNFVLLVHTSQQLIPFCPCAVNIQLVEGFCTCLALPDHTDP